MTEQRRSTLLAAASGNFSQLGIRLLVGAVVPLLLVHFETTRSSVGLALTGMWALYALFQFPSGVFADRYGERALLLLALSAALVGTVLVTVAPSFALFAVAVVILGAGTGVFFAPASALVSRLYTNEGRALGILTASGAVAGVVFPAVGGFVGTWAGWRVAVAFGLVTTLCALVAVLVLVPSTSPVNPDQPPQVLFDFDRHWELLTRPSIAYTVALGVTAGFTFQAVSSFFPTFLVDYHGLRTDVAGLVFGLIFGLSAVAQPVAGHLSDRYSRDLAIGLSVSLALSGLAVLLAVPTTVGLAVGTGLLGIGISWPGPVQARFFDRLGDDERGYGFGLLRTVYMLLASTGSVVVGVLADSSGWVVGFGSVILVLTTCLLLLVLNWQFSTDL